VRIGLNDLKMMILISMTKNSSEQLWKKMNCGKMGKNDGKYFD